MDKVYERKYHELEETNWWFEGRRHILLDMIKKRERNIKILDVGCSSGIFLQALKKEGFNHLYGVDVSHEAIELAQKRGLRNTFVVLEEFMDFDDNSFDLIVASDVLEHIENDSQALKEWKRLLKPKGKLIIFVPAYKFLWSAHDVINHHYRRYSLQQLLVKLEDHRFVIKRWSYWNFSLFVPIFIVRMIKNSFSSVEPASNLKRSNVVVNWMLFQLLKIETYLLRYISFPFGVSCFVVAEK